MADAIAMVAKLAAPIAIGGFRRLRVSFEAPWRVRRFCFKNLLPVPGYWALRRFLARAAVLEVYKSGDPSRHRELIAALQGASLAPGWALTPPQAEKLAFALLTAVTSVIAPGEATQAEVRTLGSQMAALYDASDVRATAAEFGSALHSVSRLRANDARNLVEAWPPVQRFIREFDASSERAQLLRDWVASPPRWMKETPASALLWMAGVAEDIGIPAEAFILIDRALDEGASPTAFWRLRRDMQMVPENANAQREAVRPHLDGHAIARAITAFVDGNPEGAVAELDAFEPGPHERHYSDFIQCQMLVAAGQHARALKIAEAALADGATGAAQFVADRLLASGSERTSATHFAQLNRSLELALRVRDEGRAWGGRSSAATVTAVQAYQLLGNVERALRLTQMMPAGEATELEAADLNIEDHRMILAARVLSVEQGRLIANVARASFARLEAEAILAERIGDREEAATLWQRASEIATEPQDVFRIAFHLASHGVVAANIFEVKNARRELIEEIKLLAQLSTGVPGAAETLRGSALTSRQLVFGLLEYLQSEGDLIVAGKIAADAGERWADPDLWFAAAELFHDAEEYGQAVDAARIAQRLARADWPRHRRANHLLLASLTGIGRWSDATEVAAELVAESPSDLGSRWALVICQAHLGREREAWRTFSELDARLVPRNSHEMTVRIRLWHAVEKSHDSLPEILDLAERWSNDRSVKLALVGALLFLDGDLPEHLNERVGERVRSIIAEYPDVFVPQNFDEQDVLGSLQRLVDQLPDMSGIDAKISTGEAPFGLAAAIYRRRLMQLLATRTAPLFANDAGQFEIEVAAARASRSSDGVIDSTSVMTLAYLDDEIATRAVGYVGRVIAPLRQRTDAVASLDELSSLPTLTVGRAPSGGPAIHRISDDEAVARRDLASRSASFYESLHIVERTWDPAIPELDEVLDGFVWAESLDLAVKVPGAVLWCDDLQVRQFAAALGVPAFGTSALIEAMRRDEVLTADLATFAQVVLVSRGLVGGRFDSTLAMGAAELEGWRASGAAAFLAFGPHQDDAKEQIQFVTTAMGRNLETPDVVQDWAHCMALWLVRIGGEENAEANLVMFLRAVLMQQWATGQVFLFVLEGIRTVTRERELPDPLEATLRAHFQTLTLVLEYQMASAIVRGLVQNGTADDQIAATRAVLTRG